MKTVQISIPDNQYGFYLQLFSKFEDLIIQEENFELNSEQIESLKRASQQSLESCKTVEEQKAHYKSKYGL